MRILAAVLAALAAVVGSACAGDDGQAAATTAAAPRSTATADARSPRLRARVIVRGLAAPLYVTAAPGEPRRLYVVEQTGRIRVVEGGRIRREPFLDLRSQVESGGEQGLFSIAFHPDYAQNRRFYVQFTDLNENTRIVEFRSDGTRALPGTRRQIFFLEDPYSNHNGGQLVFGPDRGLYAGMGDGGGGGDPQNRSQDLSQLFGKLLRFDVDSPGSPLRPEIVALGLRNPWRFSFDRANGDLYIGDVGQLRSEEIDYTPRGSPGLENYGWDVYEGRGRFERKDPGQGRLVFPVATYGRELGYSVTGGYVYRGRAVPSFRGRYIYGDFGTGRIWSLKVVGGRARGLRLEPFRIQSLASFGEDGAGELYAVSLYGTVYRLTG